MITYIAIVTKGFRLTQEKIALLEKKQIKVIKHFKQIDMLTLVAKDEIDMDDFDFITHIEKDTSMQILKPKNNDKE